MTERRKVRAAHRISELEAAHRPAARPAPLWFVALAVAMALVAAAQVFVRTPPVVHSQVLAARVRSSPSSEPIEATPPPSTAPTVLAQAPRARTQWSGTRTSGPRVAAPVAAKGWVQIPSVGTNAQVVRVGLDRNGSMVTPKNAKDIAWLDNGSFPGPTRNAVLAGHRNWSGVPGSLVRLEQAKRGDVVRIGLDGRVYTFSIAWVKQVDPDNANASELIGGTSVDSVTIVTCGGQFNRKTGHYEDRIVARAELVGVE